MARAVLEAMTPSARRAGALGRALRALGLGAPVRVRDLEAMEPGRVVAVGRIATSAPLASPIRGVPAAIVRYHARFLSTRARGQRTRTLREAEVYAPELGLELEGGRIDLVPKRAGDFSAVDHRALADHGFLGFRAREDVIAVGDLVMALGRARRDAASGSWTLSIERLARA